MIKFLAQVQQVSIKNCKDLSKVTRITLETAELISGELDKIPADKNVIVSIEAEG